MSEDGESAIVPIAIADSNGRLWPMEAIIDTGFIEDIALPPNIIRRLELIRMERGESQVEALRREIVEEAGIEITDIGRIGFIHLRHKTPKPPDYPYPYPDFFWSIFSARYLEDSPGESSPDEYELSTEFVAVANLGCIELSLSELAFIQEITDG